MPDTKPGEADIFGENFDNAVKGINAVKQVMKQDLFLVQTSTSAEEHFYQESTVELSTDPSPSFIPRDAEFSADQVRWTKVTLRPRKFGIESRFAWEDSIVNAIDIPARTTMRIGNRVARDVDTRAWNVASDSQSAVDIQTLAAAATFDAATRGNRIPHEDIAEAISKIADSQLQAYEPDTLVLSPKDFAFVITNDYIMGSYDSSTPELMKTGRMGTLLGLNIIKHPVVTADYALVCEAKKLGTWKEVKPLRTEVIQDAGKWITLRAWEYGNCALTDPKAVCLITNTQA